MRNRSVTPFRYFILYKPFGILCQFTDKEGKPTIAGLGDFPADVYSAGRLDADSEGLVLLTNDGRLKYALLNPQFRHPRLYLVQVERAPTQDAMEKLRRGIVLHGKKTMPAKVRLLKKEPSVPPRPVPIRYRKNVPTAWMEMVLYEGRNRQVRKMTAAVGHPTLRLIRTRIGQLTLEGLQPGEYRELTMKEMEDLRELVLAR